MFTSKRIVRERILPAPDTQKKRCPGFALGKDPRQKRPTKSARMRSHAPMNPARLIILRICLMTLPCL